MIFFIGKNKSMVKENNMKNMDDFFYGKTFIHG